MVQNLKQNGTLNVLLATKDSTIEERIKKILRANQYSLFVVGSCKEALENILDYNYDAVIFDPELNELHSSDAVQLIKKIRPKLNLIVFSDDSSYETGVKIAETGVYFRLLKPIDDDITTQLLSSLEKKANSPLE
ncbi:MAG: response regulator [bacterium]